MWNYNFILPEAIIVVTYLVFYFVQPRLPLRMTRAFFFLLLIDLFTLTVDLICTLSLEFLELTNFDLRLQNVLYFLLFFQRIICFFMFTNLVLKKDIRTGLREKIFSLLPFACFNLLAILNIFKDIIFTITDSGEFEQGPYYNLIYVCAFYYILLSFIYCFYYRKKIGKLYFISCLAYNLVMTIGYVVRILCPNWLILNFFTLLAIIIIYQTFQNPSLYLEEKSGLFNKRAFLHVLDEIKYEKEPVVIGFIIHSYNELREIYSNCQTDKGLGLIGNFLKHAFPKMKAFYLYDGRFVLLGKGSCDVEEIKKTILSRFEKPWCTGVDVDIFMEVSFIELNPEIISDDEDILFTTMLSSLNEAGLKTNACILVNKDQVEKIRNNAQIKRAVEIAVEKNSVELFLQPVIDAQTHKLIGAEALARIRDEAGEIIPPFQFIPIAEKNGRINVLGEQMFEKTCKFISEHDIEGMGLRWINVNLSPIQFLRRDLKDRFSAILQKYKIPSGKIHLEITEESMIDFDLLQKQMQVMQESGFQFVLDDYGRGYSNVARMKKCPFINIKLDMEFVWDYFKCKDKILPTLVQTIKQMDFTVTAEGIENLDMAKVMKEIGCDYLQGFCFSKPIPASEFVEIYGKK